MDYYGYVPGEYADTEEKRFGLELYDATTLLDSAPDRDERLMYLLDLAWLRGHHAATELHAREWESPYIHPNEAAAMFDKQRQGNKQ